MYALKPFNELPPIQAFTNVNNWEQIKARIQVNLMVRKLDLQTK